MEWGGRPARPLRKPSVVQPRHTRVCPHTRMKRSEPSASSVLQGQSRARTHPTTERPRRAAPDQPVEHVVASRRRSSSPASASARRCLDSAASVIPTSGASPVDRGRSAISRNARSRVSSASARSTPTSWAGGIRGRASRMIERAGNTSPNGHGSSHETRTCGHTWPTARARGSPRAHRHLVIVRPLEPEPPSDGSQRTSGNSPRSARRRRPSRSGVLPRRPRQRGPVDPVPFLGERRLPVGLQQRKQALVQGQRVVQDRGRTRSGSIGPSPTNGIAYSRCTSAGSNPRSAASSSPKLSSDPSGDGKKNSGK